MRFGDEHGHYELNTLPGNSQICVSNHAFIKENVRGQGWGKKQHIERMQNMFRLGYKAAICTVNSENMAEKHILESNGWKKVHEFPGDQVGCFNIEIWIKEVHEIANGK
jgi:RimJ/RimL family protein N-acetyltransferase